jgi:hypothetical protein
MDVVVKDDQGRFIPDLKREEFEVFEDGVKQDISSMTLSHGGRVANLLEAPPPPPPEGIILPPVRRVQDTSGRIFLFFVDDLHMQFQNTGRVRDLFKRIGKNLIHEGDLFGIVPSGPSSISIDMTYDRRRLDEAINKMTGGGLKPSEIINQGNGSGGPTELRYQAHVAFSTMNEALENLEKVHNRRKALIWAAISGPYNRFTNGSPYSTTCAPGGGTGPTCTQGNPDYRPTGYDFAVEVPAADVGTPLTVSTYDIGTYPRRLGSGSATTPRAHTAAATTTAGQKVITTPVDTFVPSDLGRPVFGVNLASNTTILGVDSPTSARINIAATATGSSAVTIGYDCNTKADPFNGVAYLAATQVHCQTGDDTDTTIYGSQNVDVQLFDTGPAGEATTSSPMSDCHQLALASDPWATFKNRWAPVCTFTPSRAGTYDLRVRNSGLPGLTDTGAGTNGFALEVTGGSNAAIRPLRDAETFANTPGSARIPIAEIPSWYAGHTISFDLFDIGDSQSFSDASIQLLGPPGAPPNTGATPIPAPGVATACHYNATGSTTRGPATPDLAATCSVTTHLQAGTNTYDGSWLRIDVSLDPAYSCDTDCTWTLVTTIGNANPASDHATWSVTAQP